MQLSLLDVPSTPQIEELREHTGQRWEAEHPQLAELACELFRIHGNYSIVADQIAPLCGKNGEGQIDGFRKIIRPVIARRLGAATVKDIIKETTLLGVMDGVAKTNELIAQAKSAKDLGAVSMATQILNTIYQLQSGGATSITGKPISETAAKLDAIRAKAQQQIEQRKQEAVEVEVLPPKAEVVG